MKDCKQIRTIGITEWCALSKRGAAPPVTICLEGSSMMPLIRRGKDPVTIVPLHRPLKIGDVVLLTTGAERYVVHRVWKLRGESIRTLGDYCVNPDPWIPREQVLGQAIHYSRNNVKHRLDTRAARFWGIVWMTMFPLRKCWILLKGIVRRRYRKIVSFTQSGGEKNEQREKTGKTEPVDCTAKCQRHK